MCQNVKAKSYARRIPKSSQEMGRAQLHAQGCKAAGSPIWASLEPSQCSRPWGTSAWAAQRQVLMLSLRQQQLGRSQRFPRVSSCLTVLPFLFLYSAFFCSHLPRRPSALGYGGAPQRWGQALATCHIISHQYQTFPAVNCSCDRWEGLKTQWGYNWFTSSFLSF